MTDLSKTIIAKSDQMNADDLVKPMTIKITEVREGKSEDQPIVIRFEGDGGKPFKPCKTVRRVLCRAWGTDGQAYVGRSMTVFNDPAVMWGGQPVGGVRVSHVSDIDEDMTIPLTITRGVKKPFLLRKLATSQRKATPEEIAEAIEFAERAASCGTKAFLDWFNSDVGKPLRNLFKDDAAVMAKLKETCKDADDQATADMAEEEFGGGKDAE